MIQSKTPILKKSRKISALKWLMDVDWMSQRKHHNQNKVCDVLLLNVHKLINIDSLDGFTFQNQLMYMYIMLVMATGQHLHTIISFLMFLLMERNHYSDMASSQGK